MAAPDESVGPSTDRHNAPVPDPTGNVRELVDAAIQRQDDLRDLEGAWRDKLDALRALHTTQMRQAEAERINAIRAVDVAASVQQTSSMEARFAELAASVSDLRKNDIADLRKYQYEAQGQKTQVVETRASTANVGTLVGIVGGVVALFAVVAALYLGTQKDEPVVVTPTVTVPEK